MKKSMKKRLLALTAAALMFSAASAQAIPNLQLYIDGGTYDTTTHTWTSTSNNFDLWVIGSGGDILDVFLATAFSTGETGTLTLTPTTAKPTSVQDTSTPIAPTLAKEGSGTIPLMGDGRELPTHSVYGAGTSWASYSLGDFTLNDSKVGDFSTASPTLDKTGQINAYHVDITGYSSVHFDAFDHFAADKDGDFKSFSNPNSHDAEGGAPVPEPGTMMLMGAGFLGLAIYGKRRQRG